jgi:hypothetical protein
LRDSAVHAEEKISPQIVGEKSIVAKKYSIHIQQGKQMEEVEICEINRHAQGEISQWCQISKEILSGRNCDGKLKSGRKILFHYV